jgi:hypothetical protein
MLFFPVKAKQPSSHLHSSFKAFVQIYQLQTENDEDETWRDLVSEVADSPFCDGLKLLQEKHGFDRSLSCNSAGSNL